MQRAGKRSDGPCCHRLRPGAGTWWHLSLFLNTHELGLAYATVSSAASIAQARAPCPMRNKLAGMAE